jgi:NAD(P)H-hydrate epimerase
VVSSPDGRFAINSTGGPLLAAGGSGDLLAGMILGLLARGMGAYEAACLGVWAHGRAAELAASHIGPYGVSPAEVQQLVPKVWDELEASTA